MSPIVYRSLSGASVLILTFPEAIQLDPYATGRIELCGIIHYLELRR